MAVPSAHVAMATAKYFSHVYMKMSSQDFVVMELDPNGCCVADPGYVLPMTTARPDETPLMPSTEPAAATGEGSAANIEAPASKCGAAVVFPYTSPLTSWLADDVVGRLRALADGSGSDDNVVLGSFAAKADRGALRCSVRWHFPALTTHVVDDLGQGSHNLIALRDVEGYNVFERCLGPEAASALVRAVIARDPSTRISCPFVADATKEDRARFHAALRKGCASMHCVVSQGFVEIAPRRNATSKRAREGCGVDADKHEQASVYTHFVVQKTNVETQCMKQLLAEVCGVTAGHIGIAGTKDRRAVTWQRASVRGDMVGAGRPLHRSKLPLRVAVDGSPNACVVVHAAAIREGPIALGDLYGNRFDITVRCVTATGVVHDGDVCQGIVRVLSERLRDMEVNGFMNLFGQQRFGRGVDACGSEPTPTTTIAAAMAPRLPGIALLRGRPEDAVADVLDTAPADVLEALRSSFNFGACRKLLNPRTHRDALMMMESLAATVGQFKGDPLSLADWRDATPAWRLVCQAAVDRIPFHMRQLWLHAAQSYIFNMALIQLARTSSCGLPPALPLVGASQCEGLAAPIGGSCIDSAGSVVRDVVNDLGIVVELLRKGHVSGVPLRGGSRECTVQPTGCHIKLCTPNAERAVGNDALWLQCQFTLPSSSYATVLLQQLFGCDVTDAD